MEIPTLFVLNIAQPARSLQSAQIIKEGIARTGRNGCQADNCADSENNGRRFGLHLCCDHRVARIDCRF